MTYIQYIPQSCKKINVYQPYSNNIHQLYNRATCTRHVLGTLNLNTENYEFPKRRFLTGSVFMSRGFNREYCNVCCSHKYDMWKYGKRYRTMLRGCLTNTAICQTPTVTMSSERTQIRMCLTGRSIYDKDFYPDY
jgi:hypothetical protein